MSKYVVKHQYTTDGPWYFYAKWDRTPTGWNITAYVIDTFEEADRLGKLMTTEGPKYPTYTVIPVPDNFSWKRTVDEHKAKRRFDSVLGTLVTHKCPDCGQEHVQAG